MREAMLEYFQAEKQEALLFLAAGLVALVASALLLRGAGPWRAMAWPLGAVALIQVAVGGGVFLRTDGQAAALVQVLERDPASYRAQESARMERVMSSFRAYKALEVLLLAAGVALTLLFPHRQALLAAGIGLILQPAFMLVLDLFAEHRGRAYLEALSRLT
jgi:hypothetical protein